MSKSLLDTEQPQDVVTRRMHPLALFTQYLATSRNLDKSKGEIRLLTILQPRADSLTSPNGDLNCQLDHCSLQDFCSSDGRPSELSRRFVALSYTWGDPDDLDEIYIDEYAVPVRQNLKNALLALRATDPVLGGCRVWCDALCINQGSVEERNSEIKRMRDIYRDALHVVVWLGDAADGSDGALDFINGISEAWLHGNEELEIYLRRVFVQQGVTLWEALSSLITRTYFSRLWIIQEIAMGGAREVLVICGKKCTTWAKLYSVYHCLHLFKVSHTEEPFYATIRKVLSSGDPAVYEAYRNVSFWKWEKCEDFQILQDSQVKNQVTNKRHLLTRCRGASCWTPLDKVYGILGLVGPGIFAKIVPDYGSSVRATYMAFTRAWIEAEGTLEALTQCGESGENYKRDPTIPSWTIDLRQQIKPQMNNFEPTYNAHRRTSSSVTFISGGSILAAKGVVFDRIDGLSGTRHWTDDFEDVGEIVSSGYKSNPYGTEHEDLTEALWRALIGDRDRLGNIAGSANSCVLDSGILDSCYAPPIPCPSTGDTDESCRWNLHLWLKRNADFKLGGKTLKAFLTNTGVMTRDPELYHQCIGRLIHFMWSRRLVTTERGYIGVAPRPVQRGDSVAVLLGCSSPLILRPSRDGKEGRFEIIAECFVLGIMNGEVVEGIQSGKFQAQEIEIC